MKEVINSTDIFIAGSDAIITLIIYSAFLIYAALNTYVLWDSYLSYKIKGERGTVIEQIFLKAINCGNQAFIQAVLFMSVFEQRLSLQMIYFKKNNYEIIVKCRWGSGGALTSTVSPWRSLGGGSRGKGSEKVWSFYNWRANK